MIFTTITAADTSSIRSNDIITGMFSPNETGSLSAIYTSSAQIGVSGMYYYDLYHEPVANDGEIQFSVAYGQIDGLGSPTRANRSDSVLPTKVIYSQYQNTLLPSGSKFQFGVVGTPVNSDDIYVINFSRARVKDSLRAGTWQLGLSGSNGLRTFIDDTEQRGPVTGNALASTVRNIRSGSLRPGSDGAVLATADTTIYGLVYPDTGIIVLHPSAISSSVGLRAPEPNARDSAGPYAPYTGSLSSPFNYQYQHEGLVRSISGSMAAGSPFTAASVESVTSQNYFLRLRNAEYNYTNNPSFYNTQTVGSTTTQTPLTPFQERPLTYPTTIGLYNDANELLAVAKLSRPLQKNEERELLVRVRLDY